MYNTICLVARLVIRWIDFLVSFLAIINKDEKYPTRVFFFMILCFLAYASSHPLGATELIVLSAPSYQTGTNHSLVVVQVYGVTSGSFTLTMEFKGQFQVSSSSFPARGQPTYQSPKTLTC